MKGLVIVAHPDDETIFFSGLIQKWRHVEWTIICVTDGNGHGRKKERAFEFASACQELNVKHFYMLGYRDDPKVRIPVADLIASLKEFTGFNFVFTHGMLGEYSHPHHQDVAYATHQVFQKKTKVYGIAYNQFPELLIPLSSRHYTKKMNILKNIYLKETVKILHQIPATWVEGFVRTSPTRANKIYSHITGRKKLKKTDSDYWLAEFTKRSTRLNRGRFTVSISGL
jgi:LmbE family N-acetylglucosaminyl deacetylase